MIIELPEKYEYKERGNKAIIVNDVLRIRGKVSFNRLMFCLAKKLKGNKCYYCNVELNKVTRTLDHAYPVSMGGPTIVPNLFPCCIFHNKEKNNYTQKQYSKFRTIVDVKEQEKFHKQICEGQELIRYKKGFDLPEEWVTYLKLEDIKNTDDMVCSSKKYQMARYFYCKYSQIPYPIILDKNYVLLSGKEILKLAKKIQLQEIPCIVLENVQQDV